nr:heparinase II/III family protein [Pelagibacterium limicola]
MEVLRFVLQRTALSLADRFVTNPIFSWTWADSSGGGYVARLAEFRPTDSQSVLEMMEGKYLLAGEMVDTAGISPFAIDIGSDAWFADLNAFGWLRHFRDLTDTGQRRFARTLVLDWIARNRRFDRDSWGVFITARRVLNWLKSYALLTEEAGPDEIRRINSAIDSQVQSLKLRAQYDPDPEAQLMAAIALTGAALSAAEEPKSLGTLVRELEALAGRQFDADGMHLSRSPLVQIRLLSELIPVIQLLKQRHAGLAAMIASRTEAMHRMLDRLVLGTREPAYMNGCGQVPVDLILSIGAQSGARAQGSGLGGGYGILVDGAGKLVADSGLVPPLGFAGHAHAGALSFEFSSGTTLVAGSCGPAPSQLPESRNLFRHSSAHSAPTIDDISSAEVGGRGFLADRLRPIGPAPSVRLIEDENALEMLSSAYRGRFGIDVARRLTLMGAGHTLVGQDRFIAAGRQPGREGGFSLRFHLAPGAALERAGSEDLIRIVHKNGEAWSFLWEGADADIEDSVRHSAHFGLLRTNQIVLSGRVRAGHEVAWVFTRQ